MGLPWDYTEEFFSQDDDTFNVGLLSLLPYKKLMKNQYNGRMHAAFPVPLSIQYHARTIHARTITAPV